MTRKLLIKVLKAINSIISTRFLIVGATNYLFGNLVFTLLWSLLSAHLSYLILASASTIISSLFSYASHTFVTLKEKTFIMQNFSLFSLVQLMGLIVSVLLVPRVASSLVVNLLLIQYLWSAIFSIVGVLLLKLLQEVSQS